MHNLNKLLKKLKKYGISLNIKYYDSIDCFVFLFEKIGKSWAFQISERDLASDLCIKSLENEMNKLIESGYFNQP